MKNFMRIVPIAILGFVAVCCSSRGGNNDGSASGAGAAVAEEMATLISTDTARIAAVPQDEVYTSTVEAFAVNNIAPLTGGRIRTIRADVSSFVAKGQILALMDEAQLDQARLKLVNDSTELARLRSLYAEGGVSRSDFEAVEMAYNVSRKSYDNLLENTILRSPISGVVSARNYDKGDLYAGQPIFVVQQITPVKLLVGISETDYTRIKVGDEVSITADALPGKEFSGKVGRIYPTVDPATRTFKVEVTVPNSDRVLRPGMFARVKVSFGVNESVVVPDVAVVKQQGSGQRFIFVLEDGDPSGQLRVRSVPVVLGRHLETSYEILEGLSEGDVIATKGSSGLRDGALVKIASEN